MPFAYSRNAAAAVLAAAALAGPALSAPVTITEAQPAIFNFDLTGQLDGPAFDRVILSIKPVSQDPIAGRFEVYGGLNAEGRFYGRTTFTNGSITGFGQGLEDVTDGLFSIRVSAIGSPFSLTPTAFVRKDGVESASIAGVLYDPRVASVPEPASLALASLALLGLATARRRA